MNEKNVSTVLDNTAHDIQESPSVRRQWIRVCNENGDRSTVSTSQQNQ